MEKNKAGEWIGNKGEWTELYVFLKLLAQGKVQAISDNLEQVEDIYYPINKIMRIEQGKQIDYVIDKDEVVVKEKSQEIMCIDRSEIEMQANCLLEGIKNGSGSNFKLPEIQTFAESIKVTEWKADSKESNDIFMQIDDTHSSHDLGFSIKSFIGKSPTIVNASHTTNFVYKVEGLICTCEQARKINEIEGANKINRRMTQIRKEYGGKLLFDGRFENEETTEIFKSNLTMIDKDMPEILAEILLDFYNNKGSGNRNGKKCKKLIGRMGESDPLRYGSVAIYEYKFKKFLCACALGMTPATPWNGLDEVNGGCIFVTKGGKILAYRIHNHNRDLFEQYLLDNTELENASTSESKSYNYMKLYVENGEVFINLNLQVRFNKTQLKDWLKK